MHQTLFTGERCEQKYSKVQCSWIQDASGAHDRPHRPEGLSIGTFRARSFVGGYPGDSCPESSTNGHLRICFSSSKRLTWWYQPIYDIWYIYIYVCIGRVKVYEMICIQTYWVIYIYTCIYIYGYSNVMYVYMWMYYIVNIVNIYIYDS